MQQQHRMEIEAEAFKSPNLKRKSVLKGMISDIDQMIQYYDTKINQHKSEIERFKSQRNILAHIITE